MSQVEKIFQLYSILHKLKTLPRTGWIHWGLKPTVRAESVAEHVFGTCALATSIFAAQKQNVNMERVFTMLALHETEEALIGDLTPFQAEYASKAELAQKAMAELFANYMNKDQILAYVHEFDSRTTPEAQFAYMCDKLEAVIQAYMYGDAFDPTRMHEQLKTNAELQAMEKEGYTSVAQKFMQYGKSCYKGIFQELAKFIEEKESVSDK